MTEYAKASLSPPLSKHLPSTSVSYLLHFWISLYQGTNEGDMKQGQRKDNIKGRKQEERSTEYKSLQW